MDYKLRLYLNGGLFQWGIVAFSVHSHSAPRGIMRIPSLKQLAPYGVAVLSVALATVVRMEFDPLLGESAPLLLFVIAVILTSWFGGFWPGLLAIILSLLVSDYFFFAPKYSLFTYDSRLDEIRAISFGILGILSSLIFARLKASIKTEREIRERFRSLVEGVKDYAILCSTIMVAWPVGTPASSGSKGT